MKSGKDNQYGIAEYCPDIQQILIDAAVNLLNHENPYTGLKDADDPGLVCVEFQNEASLMFWGGYSIRELPSYLKDYNQRFTAVLKEKYGTQEKLVEAWGNDALNVFGTKNEHLEKGNIESITDAALLNGEGLETAKENGTLQRMLDNGAFMHQEQSTYYGNYTRAVRATGYKGPLVGSCWRGKGGVTEYCNLRSDALVGIIDRHNYHEGLSGWKPRTGDTFSNRAQINMPGGGLLSSGMVQVSDRPYAFSEWATVFPNEWVLESPTIIAAYGMGLQGWDASYQFAIQHPGFRRHAACKQSLADCTSRKHRPLSGAGPHALSRRREAILEADRLLLTVMARAENTGMEFNKERNALEKLGGAPILLEPKDGMLEFDGSRDKTFYYEIVL